MTFPMPEILETETGEPRRLGVEIEFAGVPMERICNLITRLYGGTIKYDNRFVRTIHGTCWGDFQVEIDTALLKDRSYTPLLEAVGFNMRDQSSRDRVDDVIARVAETVVPLEIVTPPIPMRDVERLEKLRRGLRRLKARGTTASILYAFGLHLNPELPDTSTTTILAHMRAFLLLWDWLHVRGEVDWSRRLTPYINPFPDAYRRRVIDPAYAPDMHTLVRDYLLDNPTRNRALDMLPIFRHILGNEAVRGVAEAALVKPRPAFHYRLPNCRIDERGWTLASEWKGWVTVEWLAARPDRMAAMAHAWLDRAPPTFATVDSHWATESERWLIP